jgi:hypothetical protein
MDPVSSGRPLVEWGLSPKLGKKFLSHRGHRDFPAFGGTTKFTEKNRFIGLVCSIEPVF